MLELRTFGALELRTPEGERVEELSGRAKCLALLAFLAAETRDVRVPRETLAALLWSEGTDERARNSLRVALTHIRHGSPGRLILGEGETSLALDFAGVSADVDQFLEAVKTGDHARVVELHRGDFLAGIHVHGARDFQRWADDRRGRFRQQAYEAALALAGSALEAGDLASAEERFRTALDLGPLREEAAAGLIRTLAERGRPADAIRLFASFAERRRQELDLGPSEELRTLVESLKAERLHPSEPQRVPPEVASRTREPHPEPEPRPMKPRPPPRPGLAWLGGGGLLTMALLTAAFGAGWFLLGFGREAPPPVRERTVAVVPFGAAGSGDAGLLARGIHASLLNRLSAVSDLEVVSASAVRRFLDAGLPLRAIADSLAIRWIVEGDLLATGDEIRVDARLVDPRSGTQKWTASYRRRLTADDYFRIEADITTAIAGALEARIAPEEGRRIRHRPAGDLEAYGLYLEGRRLLDERSKPEMIRAVELFQRALARDSGLALAWAGLADAAIIIPSWGHELPEGLPAPEVAGRRALELDPDLAEAHAALAKVEGSSRDDLVATLRWLERAVDLRPSLAPANVHLSMSYLQAGRPAEALLSLERAARSDPHLRSLPSSFAQVYLANGRYGEALTWAQRARDPEPTYPVWDLESWILYHLGRLDEAERLLADEAGASNRAVLALVHIAKGDHTSARQLLAELDATPRAGFWVGLVRAGLGDVDGAFEAFGAVPREHWGPPEIRSLRYFFPDVLDPVRSDPRHGPLMAGLNRALGLNPDGSVPRGGDAWRDRP